MSTKRRGRDFESNYLAMRRRMQSLGTVVLPAPVTIGPHTHSADQITFEPYGLLAADDVQEALEEHDEEKLARDGSQTMLGNLDFNTFYIYNLGALQFDKDTAVAAVDGGLQWADDSGIERLVMTAAGDAGNVGMPVGGVYVKVLNETGSAIPAGAPVYFSGSDNATNMLNVTLLVNSLALNDTQRGGITMQAIADGEKGWVCAHGYLGGVDLSAFTDGAQLYVSAVDGEMTETVPAKGCAARIRMGQVIVAAAPGSMWVDIDWRPDLDELSNVSIGDIAAKQDYDVPMWLPDPSEGEGCHAWRDTPAARFPVLQVSTDTVLGPKDVVVLVDTSGGPVQITLPALASTPAYTNGWIRVKRVAGDDPVTIIPENVTHLIDGEDEVQLLKIGEALDFQSLVPSAWVILG